MLFTRISVNSDTEYYCIKNTSHIEITAFYRQGYSWIKCKNVKQARMFYLSLVFNSIIVFYQTKTSVPYRTHLRCDYTPIQILPLPRSEEKLGKCLTGNGKEFLKTASAFSLTLRIYVFPLVPPFTLILHLIAALFHYVS